jgi:hypothetical protein
MCTNPDSYSELVPSHFNIETRRGDHDYRAVGRYFASTGNRYPNGNIVEYGQIALRAWHGS